MARYHEQPRMKAAAQARATAVRRLIAKHAVEFERLHAQERTSRGLDKRPVALEVEYLRRRVAELEAAA